MFVLTDTKEWLAICHQNMCQNVIIVADYKPIVISVQKQNKFVFTLSGIRTYIYAQKSNLNISHSLQWMLHKVI